VTRLESRVYAVFNRDLCPVARAKSDGLGDTRAKHVQHAAGV